MVMLDIICQVERIAIVEQWCELEHWGCARPRVTIATFDHRTRESSAEDVEFVIRESRGRHLFFETARAKEAGEKSEELARVERYDFLRAMARSVAEPKRIFIVRKDYDSSRIESPTDDGAEIYTAHHLDDLVETVAINLLRGTGWRGLAVLDAPGIRRPFLEPELLNYVAIDGTAQVFTEPLDKRQILIYAAQHGVIFRQDPTNTSGHFLRNRLRERTMDFKPKMAIYQLWRQQKELKREIDAIIAQILPMVGEPWPRNWFRQLACMPDGAKVAIELLRAGLLRIGIAATRPQLTRFYQAVLDYQPGKYFNLPRGKMAKITKSHVILPMDGKSQKTA